MHYYKAHYPLIATVFFVLSIGVANFLAVDDYHFASNTISDLGAQGYSRKYVMQFGFVGFGVLLCLGAALGGMNLRMLPVTLYGACVAATGIFCTKPFLGLPLIEYSQAEASAHSVFAQLAGLFFCFGIVLQAYYATSTGIRLTHILFLVLVLVLSATFGIVASNHGIVQRLLYLVSFVWLVWFYKPLAI